jgi:trehalose synthase
MSMPIGAGVRRDAFVAHGRHAAAQMFVLTMVLWRGVAELVTRYLPALQALGVAADWRLIHGRPEFFTVTNAFHNAPQGADYDLRRPEQSLHLEVNEQSAALLDADYDVNVVHDPQPAAIRHFTGARGAKWVWRCHIDTSALNESVSRFLRPFITNTMR